ncbi:MAG: hypothetical protein HDS49_02020 [Bacteroides sp.]|nr:hypothetical protein [Bacteroides sp.]
MKRVLFAAILCACALQLKAQNRIGFLGMPISGNTKTAFTEKLIEKAYQYKGEKDGYIMYIGQFVGADASVMLVPSDSDDGIMAVVVTIDKINPVKMGKLFAELVQRYMNKYPDYKYTTTVKPDGSTQVMFRKATPSGLFDVVAIESKVDGANCTLSINYAADIKIDTASSDGGGISIDDI